VYTLVKNLKDTWECSRPGSSGGDGGCGGGGGSSSSSSSSSGSSNSSTCELENIFEIYFQERIMNRTKWLKIMSISELLWKQL